MNQNSGSGSMALSDANNHKLTRFFAFLQDELEWPYGELLYYKTMGKAPEAIRDKMGKSTSFEGVRGIGHVRLDA